MSKEPLQCALSAKAEIGMILIKWMMTLPEIQARISHLNQSSLLTFDTTHG